MSGVTGYGQDDRTAPGQDLGSSVARRSLGERLVSRVISAYRGYNRAGFTDMVSDEFPGDRSVFVGNAEKSFYSALPIRLDFFVNTVTLSEEKLAVSFIWNKTSIPRDKGTTTNSSGECTFVFKKYDKNWLLYDVKGSSPF